MESWPAGESDGFAAVELAVDRGCSEEHGTAAAVVVVVVVEQPFLMLMWGLLLEEQRLRRQ